MEIIKTKKKAEKWNGFLEYRLNSDWILVANQSVTEKLFPINRAINASLIEFWILKYKIPTDLRPEYRRKTVAK